LRLPGAVVAFEDLFCFVPTGLILVGDSEPSDKSLGYCLPPCRAGGSPRRHGVACDRGPRVFGRCRTCARAARHSLQRLDTSSYSLNQVSGLRAELTLLGETNQLVNCDTTLLCGRLANPYRLKTVTARCLKAYRTQDAPKSWQRRGDHVPCRSIPVRAGCQEAATATTLWTGNLKDARWSARKGEKPPLPRTSRDVGGATNFRCACYIRLC